MSWYLKKMEHTCINYKTDRKYYSRQCKACKENEQIKQERKAYEDMVKTTISWDEEAVLI
jgi:hypothetical protein